MYLQDEKTADETLKKRKEAAVDSKDKKEKKTVPDIKQRMNILMHQ